MSTYGFVVLLPNARRQTVSASPDTSILQILEDACKKHGLNPGEWDLKHYNRVIDLANVVRFSGLPNNATLEMVQCSKPRVESPVNVGLQLESGKRLTHQFSPQDSIWNILHHWNAKGELEFSKDENVGIACIYMRQEIVGEDKLRQKTLKSLGIFQGSVVLRIVTRQLNQVVQQANVSSVLKRPSANTVNDTGVEMEVEKQVRKTQSPGPATERGHPARSRSPSPILQKPTDFDSRSKDSQMSSHPPTDFQNRADVDMKDQTTHVPKKTPNAPRPPSPKPPPVKKDLHVARGVLQSLGSEGAYIYHADDVIVNPNSVPDDFFEITVDDVKSMYRNLQSKRREMEETPLQLRAVREEEHEKWLEACLATHPTTVVRIRFPDRKVLQGTFKSNDSFAVIYNFVRQYLEKDDLDFYLFVTPPRKVLTESSRLIDEDLIGLAVIYFGSSSQLNNYLKQSLPLSDPEQVFNATTRIVQNSGNTNTSTSHAPPPAHHGEAMRQEIPGSSHESKQTTDKPKQQPTASRPRPENTSVVPKWFKK